MRWLRRTTALDLVIYWCIIKRCWTEIEIRAQWRLNNREIIICQFGTLEHVLLSIVVIYPILERNHMVIIRAYVEESALPVSWLQPKELQGVCFIVHQWCFGVMLSPELVGVDFTSRGGGFQVVHLTQRQHAYEYFPAAGIVVDSPSARRHITAPTADRTLCPTST